MPKDGDDLKAAAFCFFFGGTLVWNGIRRMRRARQVEDTPSTNIASAPQGLTEIQGFAWPRSATSLTLKERRAVYHCLKLKKLVKQGKSSKWKTVWKSEKAAPFYVLDSTGAVLVDPGQAELDIKKDVTRWSHLSEARKMWAVTNLGITAADFPPVKFFFGLASAQFRFEEKALLLGAPVYVHGTLRPRDSASLSHALPSSLALQRFQSFLKRINGSKVSRYKGFDLNRDGKICETEVERALNEIGENAFDPKREGELPPLPGSSPEENRIFGTVGSCEERKLYIANCHQEHLLKRIGANNVLMIIGGALLIGVGAFIVALRSGPF